MVSPGPLPDQPRQIIGGVVVIMAVIAGFGLACFLGGVLFLLFIGVVLATALKPIIEVIQYRGIRQPVAVGAVYACIGLLLVVVVILGVLPLIHLGKDFASEISLAAQQARQWLAERRECTVGESCPAARGWAFCCPRARWDRNNRWQPSVGRHRIW